jgi:FkbM family methyltransferase
MDISGNLRQATPFAVKSSIKIVRARMAEWLGSTRYSYPALNDLDRHMLDRLPAHGTFLEIGANDGYSQSNTYYLERFRGWRGILIEPLPELYRLCAAHRRRSVCFNYACLGPDGPSSLILADRGLMTVGLGLLPRVEEEQRRGGVERTVSVPATQMSELIDRAALPGVTFMSIDVEGAEMHVLAGLDLDRHCPDFLLIETGQVNDVSEALGGYMILTEQLTFHDYLFEQLP